MSSLIVSFAKPTLFRSRNAMKYSNTISGNIRRLTLRIVRSPNSPSDSTDGRDPATAASNHLKGNKRDEKSGLVRVDDVSAQIGLCLVHVGLHGISAPLGITGGECPENF